MLLFGACNGAQLQMNMILHFYLLVAGIKLSTILTVMEKRNKNSVKDTFLVIPFR
jgi:hypothetical protein